MTESEKEILIVLLNKSVKSLTKHKKTSSFYKINEILIKRKNELIEKIKNSIEQYNVDDIQLHHFHIHNYVGHQELTFHIKLKNDLSIEEGHKIATDIENIVHKRFGITSTIHVEPLNFNHSSD